MKLVHEKYLKDPEARGTYLQEFTEATQANEAIKPLLARVSRTDSFSVPCGLSAVLASNSCLTRLHGMHTPVYILHSSTAPRCG